VDKDFGVAVGCHHDFGNGDIAGSSYIKNGKAGKSWTVVQLFLFYNISNGLLAYLFTTAFPGNLPYNTVT